MESAPVGVSLGEQGWRNGESTRLPPMWFWFDSRTRRHMWVEFVVGSRMGSRHRQKYKSVKWHRVN